MLDARDRLLAELRIRAGVLGLIRFASAVKAPVAKKAATPAKKPPVAKPAAPATGAGGDWVRKTGPSGAVYWQRGAEKRYQQNKPGTKKVAGPQAAKKPAASKPPVPAKPAKPDVAGAKALLFRGMQGKASLAEVAAALSGLPQKDVNALKKLWGQKAGGTKAAQAAKLAEWALGKAGAGEPDAPAKKPPPFPTGDQFAPWDPAADKELRSSFESLKATASEKAALRAYTSDKIDDPDCYANLNRFLRGTLTDAEVGQLATYSRLTPEQFKGRMKEAVAQLDAVLRRAKLPRPVVAMRGLTLGPEAGKAFMANLEAAAKSGKPVQLKGYQSTSTSPAIAGIFGGGGGAVMMEIMASRGAYVPGVSESPDEAELLLPRDDNYRVAGFREVMKDGQPIRVVQLEQL